MIKLRGVLAGTVIALALSGCSNAPRGPDHVFVSDEEADVVHVLDGVSGAVEGVLQTGERPRGLALSPDGNTLYVAASDANRIEAWNSHTLAKIRDIGSGSDPERIAVSADGRTIYVANEDESAVSFIDVASGKVRKEVQVGPEPEGIGISPDGKQLIATSEVASVAHFIDVATAKVMDNMPVGSRPREVLFVDGGKEAWVSSEQRGTIHVFDAATHREKRTIDLVLEFPDLEKVQAVELELTPDGRRAFVAMGRGDQVAEIDPKTYRVVRAFPTGHRTWGISLSPDASRLYAASGLSGTVTIIDLKTNRVRKTIRLGGKPWTTEAALR